MNTSKKISKSLKNQRNLIELSVAEDESGTKSLQVSLNERIDELLGLEGSTSLDHIFSGIQIMAAGIASLASSMIELGEEPEAVITASVSALMEHIAKVIGVDLRVEALDRSEAETLGLLRDDDGGSGFLS